MKLDDVAEQQETDQFALRRLLLTQAARSAARVVCFSSAGESSQDGLLFFNCVNGEESVIVSLSPWGTGDAKRLSFTERQAFLVMKARLPFLALSL